MAKLMHGERGQDIGYPGGEGGILTGRWEVGFWSSCS